MDPEFMETLEKIREEVGIPNAITSAWDPAHPIEAKKSQPKPTQVARLIDILIRARTP